MTDETPGPEDPAASSPVADTAPAAVPVSTPPPPLPAAALTPPLPSPAPAADVATDVATAPATASGSRSTAAHSRGDGRPPGPTLCIDVGGSGVKGGTVGVDGKMLADMVRIPTTYPLTPDHLVEMVSEIARQSPKAGRLSMGFPGMVRAGHILSAPHFITKAGPGTKVVPALRTAWEGCPLADKLHESVGLPVRLANDADTQGLAAIEGKGVELVVTLGTGVGTALFFDGELMPHMEFAQTPLRKDLTYNEVIGDVARRKLGAKRWSKRVDDTVQVLAALIFYDTLYLGGGNATKLTKDFTQKATVVPNADGILGGAKLWSLNKVP